MLGFRSGNNGLSQLSISNVSVKEVIGGYNKPRLDYSDSSCPSLLLEPQRTNLIPYSEDYSTSTYNAIGSVVTESNQIDPRGTNTAYKLTNFASTNDRLDGNSTMTAVDGVTYTYSAYYKGSGTIRINCSTTTGVGGGGEKDILLTDEWKKEEISFTASNPTGAVKSHVAITRTANNDAIVYVAFSQIEQGSYATSYIPTTNGIIKTRLQDECTDAGDSSTFNDSEGVFMFETQRISNGGHYSSISLDGGDLNNYIGILYRVNTNEVWLQVAIGGVQQFSEHLHNIKHDENHKFVIKYENTSFNWYLNGFLIATNTASSMPFSPNTLNNISFVAANASENFYGKTKQIQYFDSALTDLELEEISSWDSFIAMANGQNYTIK